MVGDLETLGLGHGVLAGFDFGIVELLHPTAVQTDHVVVVLPLVEFINRLAALEMVSAQNTRLLELGQHPVNGGQADLGVPLQQLPKNIFCRHVAHRPVLKNLQDFQPGQGGFEAIAFQFIDVAHERSVSCLRQALAGPRCRYNDPDHIGTHPTMTASPTFRFAGRVLATALVAWGLAGCSAGSGGISRDTFRPYVAEIVQGNFISQEQRQVLRPGMPRAQVREILGTPLVASLFHADRWDYAFSIQRQGVPPQSFRLTVHFKDDLLTRIEGDELPSESQFAGLMVKSRAVGKLPRLEASEDDLKKFAVTPTVQPPSPLPPPAPRSYPPLEPAAR